MSYCFSHHGLKPFICEGMNILDFKDQWGVPIIGSPPGNPSVYALNTPWSGPGPWKGFKLPSGQHHWMDRRVPQGTWVDQGQALISQVWQQNDFGSLYNEPQCILPNGAGVSPTLNSDYFVGWPMQVKSWVRQMVKRSIFLTWVQRRNSFGYPDDFDEWFETYQNQVFENQWGKNSPYFSNYGQQQANSGGINSGFMAMYYPFQPMDRVSFGRTVFMNASAGGFMGTDPADWDHLQMNPIIHFVSVTYAAISHNITDFLASEGLSVTISVTASGKTKNTLRQIHGFPDGTTITSKFVDPGLLTNGLQPATGSPDAVMYYCPNWEESTKPGGFQRIMGASVELGPVSDGICTWDLTPALDIQPNQESGGQHCFYTCPRHRTMPPMVDGAGWGLSSYGGWSIARANQKETVAECPGPHRYPVGGTQPVGGFGDGGSVLGRLNAPHYLWS